MLISFIIIFAFLMFLVPNPREKKRILSLIIIFAILLMIQTFSFIGEEKKYTRIYEGTIFLIIFFSSFVLIFWAWIQSLKRKKLYKSTKIVNGTITYVKQINRVNSNYLMEDEKTQPKYRIVFEYEDYNRNKKQCHTYKVYTLEEVNKIKKSGSVIKITVAGKICEINEELLVNHSNEYEFNVDYNKENSQQEDANNLENIPVHKIKRNIGFGMDLFCIVSIIIFFWLAFFFISYDDGIDTTDITAAIVLSIMVLVLINQLCDRYKIRKAYNNGTEAFAIRFHFQRAKYFRFIVFYYKRDDGKIKRKKQAVPFDIYENANCIEKLPIKVLGNNASVDIEKVANFREYRDL
jgi:hypothetical protein